ncbi:MAG: ferritin-like domain-containing protein [Candidatus Nitrosopolaris sp.]|jgi:starvation-inducible DNA-binding protein
MQSTKTKIDSYPAPTQLATKTDLSPQEAKAISKAVNPLIADAFALYVKTKNFHWHLYGSHFRDYHLLLDEHADAIFDSIGILSIWGQHSTFRLSSRSYQLMMFQGI